MLFGIVWASLSNLIALRTKNSELTMVAGLFLTLPALFLSSAFFPAQLLPGWLRAVAKANPAAYVIQAGQRLMSTGNNWGQDLRTLAVIVIAPVNLHRGHPLGLLGIDNVDQAHRAFTPDDVSSIIRSGQMLSEGARVTTSKPGKPGATSQEAAGLNGRGLSA